MFIIAIATAVLFTSAPQADQPATQTYTDPQLGLSFTHPATWILESPDPGSGKGKSKHQKRPKRKDQTVEFRVPIAGAADDADLQIMRASFSGSSDTWQQIQVDANKNMKREVEKQWEQEILGVPLLLTKINYTDNSSLKTTLTGLLYNDTPKKLLFRLTGPAGDFDKAQYEFTESMQSLRTLNNTLPKEQDPNALPKPKEDDRGAKHVIIAPEPPPKPKLAPMALPVTVSTKNIELRVPRGWETAKKEGNTLVIENPALGYAISLSIYSTLDSEAPNSAFARQTGQSLKEFTTVGYRHDTTAAINSAGCLVATVLRSGSGSGSQIMTFDAAGVEGDFYFIANCRPHPGPTFKYQKKLLDALFDQISIEPGS
jgi:hypothetical protein